MAPGFAGIDWPDVWMRSWKTFYQAALALVVGGQLADISNVSEALDVGQAALWAGLVALMSFLNNAVAKPVYAWAAAWLQTKFGGNDPGSA